MSETKEPQEAREFWIYRNEEYAPTYACDFNQRGFVPSRNRESIHVIEYSEYENLKKENAVLREALEFYADRCKGHEGMAPQYNELNDLNCINENFGETARQALSKIKSLGIVKEGEK